MDGVSKIAGLFCFSLFDGEGIPFIDFGMPAVVHNRVLPMSMWSGWRKVSF